MSNGRLSSSSLASTTPSTVERGQLVERADDRARCRRPAPAIVVGRSATSTGRAPRRAARRSAARAARRAAPASARRARSAARARTRARPAARRARGGRCPRPASTTTNGSGSPSSCHHSVERAGDARAEQRTDLGAGDEVAAGPPGAVTRREEPARGRRARARRTRSNGIGPSRWISSRETATARQVRLSRRRRARRSGRRAAGRCRRPAR